MGAKTISGERDNFAALSGKLRRSPTVELGSNLCHYAGRVTVDKQLLQSIPKDAT